MGAQKWVRCNRCRRRARRGQARRHAHPGRRGVCAWRGVRLPCFFKPLVRRRTTAEGQSNVPPTSLSRGRASRGFLSFLPFLWLSPFYFTSLPPTRPQFLSPWLSVEHTQLAFCEEYPRSLFGVPRLALGPFLKVKPFLLLFLFPFVLLSAVYCIQSAVTHKYI